MAKPRRSARSAATDEITHLENDISSLLKSVKSALKTIDEKRKRIVDLRKQNRLENDSKTSAESKLIGD